MYQVTRLQNGLTVATAEMPHMASVSLGLWVGVGGRFEPKELNGVSHFIEHMLFKGTRKRSAKEISQSVEGIGGYLNAFTSEENTCFYSKARHDKFDELLDVLMDMFHNSVFESHEIEKERGVIKEELAMYLDQPHQHVYELLNETLWPDHPLGRSLTGLGSTQNLWLYSASASDGFRLPSNWVLLGSASVTGQTGYAPLDRQLASGSIRFYGRADSRSLTFVSLSGDTLKDPNASSQLTLGGDTGLRGYPRSYQTGDRRLLLNVEERVYTDWYPFRLIRVGGAAFYDLGRAWSGPAESPSSARWLSDVGFGLRILSARSSFGNVLHVDFAFPLNRDPNIKSFQFLVQTKLSL